MFRSAKAKIQCSILAFFSVVILIISTLSYLSFSTSSEAMKRSELDTVAEAVGKAVSAKINEYFMALDMVSDTFTLVVSEDEVASYVRRQELLTDLMTQTKALQAYYAFPNGQTHTTDGLLKNFDQKVQQREWFARILKEGESRVITKPYISSDGHTVMSVGVPVRRQDEVIAAICLNLNMTTITQYAQSVLNFKELVLTRADGYIMANKDMELIGKSLWAVQPELEKFNNGKGSARISFVEKDEAFSGAVYTIPELGWKVWAFEKDKLIKADSLNNLYSSGYQALAALLISVFMIGMLLKKLVFSPLERMDQSMQMLAKGDFDVMIPGLGRQDEIGKMSKSVQVFKENGLHMKELEIAQAAQKRKAEEDRKAIMLKMAGDFEARVGEIIKGISVASTQLSGASEGLSLRATETNEKSTSVAVASEEASANVAVVASATEELSGAIQEIGSQVQRSATIAERAVEAAEGSNHRINGLTRIVGQIGAVADLINDIADQTNLLALNATIEAARAGDAGKGFAVVANEVKKLATETAKATTSITEQIGQVQTETDGVVTAIADISNVIAEMSSITTSIASSIEEQSAATAEIARNVELAATGTEGVSVNIVDVRASAETTDNTAQEIHQAAASLSDQADVLQSEVSGFLQHVRLSA